MVLSEQDKKILLDRLKAGREKKKAEREAAAKKKPLEAAVPAEQPVSAPTTAQETAPAAASQQHAEQLPSEPPRTDPSKARKAAKKTESSSESDSDIEDRKKKKTSKTKNDKKNVPYMKIKIYAEPKNHEALNALIGAAVQQEDEHQKEPALTPENRRVTSAIPKQKLAQSIVRPNTMRSLAMDIFG